jgi:hypothetical protein
MPAEGTRNRRGYWHGSRACRAAVRDRTAGIEKSRRQLKDLGSNTQPRWRLAGVEGPRTPCPVNDLADSGAVTGPAEPSGNPIRCPTVEHLAQEKRTSMAWFIWGVGGSRLCTGQNRHRFSAPVNWRSPRPAVGIAFAHQAIAATVLARWRSRRVPRIAAAR